MVCSDCCSDTWPRVNRISHLLSWNGGTNAPTDVVEQCQMVPTSLSKAGALIEHLRICRR